MADPFFFCCAFFFFFFFFFLCFFFFFFFFFCVVFFFFFFFFFWRFCFLFFFFFFFCFFFFFFFFVCFFFFFFFIFFFLAPGVAKDATTTWKTTIPSAADAESPARTAHKSNAANRQRTDKLPQDVDSVRMAHLIVPSSQGYHAATTAKAANRLEAFSIFTPAFSPLDGPNSAIFA